MMRTVTDGLRRLVSPRARGDVKSSHAPWIAIDGFARPQWMARDYSAFAREGVMTNPVVYRAVRLIAEAVASVPLTASNRGADADRPPLLALLDRPNPAETRVDLMEAWISSLLISGNGYLKAAATGGEVRELHVLRPDRVKVLEDGEGHPAGFEYCGANGAFPLLGEVVAGVPPVLHLKLFHPLSDTDGLSPIEAAAVAIDIHNTASRWNKALLDNAARPSGALVYTSGGHLTADQFSRLKGELEENFQGARNAGRPLLLEGGLDWKAMSLTPRDMDFMEAKNGAARDIALAIGVPPMLLGIPGDNTYSNYQEANRTFWRQTVLPIAERAASALSHWLGPAFPDPVSIRPDVEAVAALSGEREAFWARIGSAHFLTLNEKRAAIGCRRLCQHRCATAAGDIRFDRHHAVTDRGPRHRPFPWDAAIGFGLGVLRLSSDEFWRLTPRELAAAARGRLGQSENHSPDRAALDRLIETFPDVAR